MWSRGIGGNFHPWLKWWVKFPPFSPQESCPCLAFTHVWSLTHRLQAPANCTQAWVWLSTTWNQGTNGSRWFPTPAKVPHTLTESWCLVCSVWCSCSPQPWTELLGVPGYNYTNSIWLVALLPNGLRSSTPIRPLERAQLLNPQCEKGLVHKGYVFSFIRALSK